MFQTTDTYTVQNGVGKGCALSPFLLNFVIKKVKENENGTIGHTSFCSNKCNEDKYRSSAALYASKELGLELNTKNEIYVYVLKI